MVFGKKKKPEEIKTERQDVDIGKVPTPPPEQKERTMYEHEDFASESHFRAELLNMGLILVAESRACKEELKRAADTLERMEKAQ